MFFNSFTVRNNYCAPRTHCFPQVMVAPRPMMVPMGPSVFYGGGYGGGCCGGNRAMDYMTTLAGLSMFSQLMNRVVPTFTGNPNNANNANNSDGSNGQSSQFVSQNPNQASASFLGLFGKGENGEGTQEISDRKAARIERREAKKAAREAKKEAAAEEAIANGRDPNIKKLGGFIGRLFPKLETRHYAKKALGKDFIKDTKQIAKGLNCKTNDLLAVMNQESSLNPTAVNKNSGASGLIQFTPDVARELGTSVEEVRQMSAEEQLPYIREYLVSRKETAGFAPRERLSAGDLYALVLAPARAKDDMLYDSVENKTAYNANKGLDVDKDGQITKADLDTCIENKQVELA